MKKKSIEKWLKDHLFESYEVKMVTFECKLYFTAFYKPLYSQYPPFIKLTEGYDDCIFMNDKHFTDNEKVTKKLLLSKLKEYNELK